MNLSSSRASALAIRSASVVLTVLTVLAAIWAARQLWDHYELAPWTRDGRVRANVVQIAPDVSGLVTRVDVQDNQRVSAGAVLFDVDSARYTLALRQAQTAQGAQRIALAQALRESARNTGLGNLVSQEGREQTDARTELARVNLAQAEVAVDAARLNLERARVRAPSDGQVTNLDLRTGSYASAGRAVLALVDAGSFYVEGYFEETKLARIHLGDRVQVTLMGGGEALGGTVDSMTAAIADHDRSTSPNLLPSVNPTFNWVRLPQRIPVHVKLDALPAGTRLVAGETVTVQVLEAKPSAVAARAASVNASAAASLAAPAASPAASAFALPLLAGPTVLKR